MVKVLFKNMNAGNFTFPISNLDLSSTLKIVLIKEVKSTMKESNKYCIHSRLNIKIMIVYLRE